MAHVVSRVEYSRPITVHGLSRCGHRRSCRGCALIICTIQVHTWPILLRRKLHITHERPVQVA